MPHPIPLVARGTQGEVSNESYAPGARRRLTSCIACRCPGRDANPGDGTECPRLSKLPAETQIPLKMTQTVITKGNSWKEGDQFNLAVAADVKLGDYTVIPAGTKAVGRIKWLTSRGAFGIVRKDGY